MKDYYKLLNLKRYATEQEIKKAYREQAMNWHPDRNKSTNAHNMFIQITEAYEILSNPEKRTEYDSLFFAEESVTVTTEFANWQSQAKSKAQEYAKMDFELFQKRILNELILVAKHSPGLGCLTFIIFGAISGLGLIIKSAVDGNSDLVIVGVWTMIFYLGLSFWAYKRFVPDYQKDRKNISKN